MKKLEHTQVIDDPKLSTRGRSVAEKVITVTGSGALLYVFTPITFVAWYFAGVYALDTIFSWRHAEDTFNILLKLIVVASVSAVCFLGWSEYNFRSYAYRTRRTFPLPVSVGEIAKTFHISEASVLVAQNSKFMEFHVLLGKHIICDNEQGCVIVKEFEGNSRENSAA